MSGQSTAKLDGYPIFIQKDPLADLAVVEGDLVIADPYAINHGLAIKAEGIPTGRYPVELYSECDPNHGDRAHLAFILRFSEEIPTVYNMVLPEGVKESDLTEGAFFGLATESGNITMMTNKTCFWLLEHPEAAAEVLQAIEEEISLSFMEIGGAANIKLPDLEANLVTAVAHGEPGLYPAFKAYNTKGDLLALIIDFTAPNHPA